MGRNKTLTVVCVIIVAALFGGCQGAQQAAAPNQAAPVMKAQPAQKPVPVKAAGTTSAASSTTTPDATHASAAAAGPKVITVRQEEPIVATITGCLERAGDLFRLTDTSGDNAPKSRSWKSGFIKKGTASIDIVEGATRLKLADHLGRRVSITGLLADRQMQARSVRATSDRCE